MTCQNYIVGSNATVTTVQDDCGGVSLDSYCIGNPTLDLAKKKPKVKKQPQTTKLPNETKPLIKKVIPIQPSTTRFYPATTKAPRRGDN